MRDKVWLTAHVRMVAESQLRVSHHLWNILIIWYSTCLTCLTIYHLVTTQESNAELMAAILSVMVLSLSIYIPTLGLKQKADTFRSCYLKLQRALDTITDEAELAIAYHDILGDFPNHDDGHWIALIVQYDRRGEPLESDGERIPVTCGTKLGHYFERTRYGTVWFAGFGAPLLIYYFFPA